MFKLVRGTILIALVMLFIADQLICGLQLLLRSKTRYFSRGSIIADSRENARGLIVITAGQVCTK